MKIRPVTQKLTATALTDPDPSFVSMCKGVGPANQEPFRAVRSEDPEAPEEAAPMKMSKAKASTNAVAALAQKGHGVMQFQFDKTVFKTAEDVTAWLEDGGYSDYEIAERAKSFEVNDEDGKYEVGTIQPIDAAEGVRAFVGKISGEEQVEDGEPEGETVEKTDDTDADLGAGNRPDIDPAPRAKAGNDKKPAAGDEEEDEEEASKGAGGSCSGKPKKKDEDGDAAPAPEGEDAEKVEAEKHGGKKKPITDDDKKAETDDEDEKAKMKPKKKGDDEPVELTDEQAEELRTKMAEAMDGLPMETRKHIHPYIVSDIGSAIATLKYIILDADYTGLDAIVVSNLKTAAIAAADAMVAVANQLKGEIAEFVAQKTEELEAAVKEAKAKTDGEQRVSEEAEDDTAAPEQADEGADKDAAQKTTAEDDPMEARLAAMEAKFEARVKAAEDKADAATAKAEKAEAELAERVAADEARSQSRKAADNFDLPEEEKKPAQRCQASTTMLSAFGSRHARG